MSKRPAPATGVADRHPELPQDISLREDEVVLAIVHPSWATWLTPLSLAAALVVAALVAMAVGDLGAFVGELVIAGVVVAYVYLARSYSHYIVTNQRVRKTVGLFRTEAAETNIAEIRALTTHQGRVDRFLDTGSVNIDSGSAGGFIGISGVPEHEELAEYIRAQQRKPDPAPVPMG